MLDRVLVIDTETGGVDPHVHPLLSLAAVVLSETGEVKDSFALYIREPSAEITAESFGVHRISKERIEKEGVAPKDAVARLHAFLASHFPDFGGEHKIVLAGHNVPFDREFLRRLYRMAGVEFSRYYSYRMIDTASIYAFLIMVGIVPRTEISSDAMFRALGVPIADKDRHTALTDALTTAAALRKMIEVAQVAGKPGGAVKSQASR